MPPNGTLISDKKAIDYAKLPYVYFFLILLAVPIHSFGTVLATKNITGLAYIMVITCVFVLFYHYNTKGYKPARIVRYLYDYQDHLIVKKNKKEIKIDFETIQTVTQKKNWFLKDYVRIKLYKSAPVTQIDFKALSNSKSLVSSLKKRIKNAKVSS